MPDGTSGIREEARAPENFYLLILRYSVMPISVLILTAQLAPFLVSRKISPYCNFRAFPDCNCARL
jgi:hypothetical protein